MRTSALHLNPNTGETLVGGGRRVAEPDEVVVAAIRRHVSILHAAPVVGRLRRARDQLNLDVDAHSAVVPTCVLEPEVSTQL